MSGTLILTLTPTLTFTRSRDGEYSRVHSIDFPMPAGRESVPYFMFGTVATLPPRPTPSPSPSPVPRPSMSSLLSTINAACGVGKIFCWAVLMLSAVATPQVRPRTPFAR